MNTRNQLAKVLTLLCLVCVGYVVAAPSQAFAVTKRKSEVTVKNNSGRDIDFITVIHKYSDNYKNSGTFVNLANGASSHSSFGAEYNTGFGTTGQDWWRVAWKYKGDSGYYMTNPKNLRLGPELETMAPQLLKLASTAFKEWGANPLGASSIIGGKSLAPLTETLMNGDSTDYFKEHLLREEDAGSTEVQVFAERVIFHSSSGETDTVFLNIGELPGFSKSPTSPNQEGGRSFIRTGTFAGIWHSNKAQFKIDRVYGDGFTGSATLLEGDSKGYVLTFNGKLEKGNVLTLSRTDKYPNGGTNNGSTTIEQVSKAGYTQYIGQTYAWSGFTTGAGLPYDKAFVFELRVPMLP